MESENLTPKNVKSPTKGTRKNEYKKQTNGAPPGDWWARFREEVEKRQGLLLRWVETASPVIEEPRSIVLHFADKTLASESLASANSGVYGWFSWGKAGNVRSIRLGVSKKRASLVELS